MCLCTVTLSAQNAEYAAEDHLSSSPLQALYRTRHTSK